MWIGSALLSALFAGITAILAKSGIKSTNTNLATAIRTLVVLVFAWSIVFISGSENQILSISSKTLIFLILSGLSTGASWLCYFRALQKGDVNKVVPVDKSSIILTCILAFIIFGEEINIFKGIGLIMIGIGTYLMIEKKHTIERKTHIKNRIKTSSRGDKISVDLSMVDSRKDRSWLFYAFGSAIFASLTSILGKIGVEDIDSNLAVAIRTFVVLMMAWAIVFATNRHREIRKINKRELLFLLLSGITTGISWLFFYNALQNGPASIVIPIDKLSILVSIIFSFFLLGERLSLKSTLGLFLIVSGTMLMLL